LPSEALEHAVEFDAFEVDHQTLGFLTVKWENLTAASLFEGHAGVVGSRPDTHASTLVALAPRTARPRGVTSRTSEAGRGEAEESRRVKLGWFRKAFRH
jgi:hypothetical protein